MYIAHENTGKIHQSGNQHISYNLPKVYTNAQADSNLVTNYHEQDVDNSD
jgi:hypothetical protein